jgi:hypothetical protein
MSEEQIERALSRITSCVLILALIGLTVAIAINSVH